MKWNIDQELANAAKLLGGDGLGISIKRVLLTHSLFQKFDLKILNPEQDASPVWAIQIPWHASFFVVCGHTLHEAKIRLRRKLKRAQIWNAKKKRRFKNERRRVQLQD